jgi:hypothetical protein
MAGSSWRGMTISNGLDVKGDGIIELGIESFI